MLQQGTGGPANPAGAVPFLRQAAVAGVANAQNFLALALFNGEGVPADKAAAMTWWDKEVAQKHGRSEARRVWNACVSTCRPRWSTDHYTTTRTSTPHDTTHT